MFKQPESRIKEVRDSGCYFICLCDLAGLDPDTVYDNAVKQGFIDRDCTVRQYGAPFLAAHGLRVRVEVMPGLRKSARIVSREHSEGTYILECYNNRTGYTHFVLLRDGVMEDPIPASVTAREGFVVTIRKYIVE